MSLLVLHLLIILLVGESDGGQAEALQQFPIGMLGTETQTNRIDLSYLANKKKYLPFYLLWVNIHY